MAGEPTVIFTGRVGADPTISFTQSGRAVANLSVAVTPRTKDNDEWVDKETVWFRVSLWRNAEAAVEELLKGDLVTVTGKLAYVTYKAKDGSEKTALEVDADHIGVIPTTKTHSVVAESTPW